MGLYDLSVKNIKGEDVSLSKYKGKVLLIVNTASECIYTPQYEGLEVLYQEFQKKGFEVLDFPCNQFFLQAPGTDEELAEFCQVKYGTTFQTFAKIKVNGTKQHPLYAYLKRNLHPEVFPVHLSGLRLFLHKVIRALTPLRIRWNFTKFLVDQNGEVVARFAPKIKPEKLHGTIKTLLSNNKK